LLQAAQAQKHVTHNEALMALDVLVQLSVSSRALTVPPVSPPDGTRHIVPVAATAAWSGQTNKIALWQDGAWQFLSPLAGWRAWIAAEEAVAIYSGTAWKTTADAPLSVPQLGVSATPDATNRLAVTSPATLFNHAGAGHQLKLNKSADTDTASLMFQTGFSGRAEMGTTGADDFAIKVSPDGAAFFDALSVARASGQVTLPQILNLGGQPADPPSPADGMVWLNTSSGEVKVRSIGTTQVVGANPVPDGTKGDIIVSGAGADWRLSDPVKYGLNIALNARIFSN
jgi:hypothetical protein